MSRAFVVLRLVAFWGFRSCHHDRWAPLGMNRWVHESLVFLTFCHPHRHNPQIQTLNRVPDRLLFGERSTSQLSRMLLWGSTVTAMLLSLSFDDSVCPVNFLQRHFATTLPLPLHYYLSWIFSLALATLCRLLWRDCSKRWTQGRAKRSERVAIYRKNVTSLGRPYRWNLWLSGS